MKEAAEGPPKALSDSGGGIGMDGVRDALVGKFLKPPQTCSISSSDRSGISDFSA